MSQIKSTLRIFWVVFLVGLVLVSMLYALRIVARLCDRFSDWLTHFDWSDLRRVIVSLLWLVIIFYFARFVRAVAHYWEAKARREGGRQ
jgi:hypothetical protein